MRQLAWEALGGEITRLNQRWIWRAKVKGSRRNVFKLIGVKMASSGQKANWPLSLLAQALLSWKASREIEPGTTIYVEEPEIHLHPEAQWAFVQILAILVKQGFRVVVSTHSLIVLYAVNNLVQAGRVPTSVKDDALPPGEMRLSKDDVAAVLFRRDGSTQSLVHPR